VNATLIDCGRGREKGVGKIAKIHEERDRERTRGGERRSVGVMIKQ
jgi:hypothetical protein